MHNVVSSYNRCGPEAVDGSKESKRRRCYLSKTEEAEFLATFLDQAGAGQICVAGRIKMHWKIIWAMRFIILRFTGCLTGTVGGR
ncbi:MAG: hypothetical protein WC647_03920 [Desulfomonilaceae bacterium]